jgi:hypothetical protein
MADTALTIAEVADILSTPGWRMTGGQNKSELGLLVGESLEVAEALGYDYGSNLLVGYRLPTDSEVRINDSVLWSKCNRPDGTNALILAFPCQYAHPSGNVGVIRVSDLDPNNTVMMFVNESLRYQPQAKNLSS